MTRERALAVAREAVGHGWSVPAPVAAELLDELARSRAEVEALHGELSDVLGEVRALLDGPDHVRSAAARLLRKRLNGPTP